MTEPVPGQTPEPAAADDATAPPPPAREPETAEPGSTGHETPEPGTTEFTSPDPVTPGPGTPDPATPDSGATAGDTTGAGPAVDPQELFGSLSLSAIEADIDRLMSDKMSQLDGMLAGLEELVQKLEGEITNLEPPPDEADTPRG